MAETQGKFNHVHNRLGIQHAIEGFGGEFRGSDRRDPGN